MQLGGERGAACHRPQTLEDDLVTREDFIKVGFGLGADNTLHATHCAVTITPINGIHAAHYRLTLKLPYGAAVTAVVHASAIRRHDDDGETKVPAPGSSRRTGGQGC